MLKTTISHSLVANHKDLVPRNASHFRGFDRIGKAISLSSNSPRLAILQLERKLLSRISGICWREDAASPESSKHYGGSIYAIGRVECQNIAFSPIPEGAETLSKIERSGLEAGKGVMAARIGIRVQY
jgi:hypothetical protein